MDVVILLEWVFLFYFAGLNCGYLSLNLISLWWITRYMGTGFATGLPQTYEEFYPPISVIVPAYNEERGIIQTVRSISQLEYPELEIIVVNDGSKDETLNRLLDEFDCFSLPEVYRQELETEAVREIYRSSVLDNLRVLDKENGGKADALNAGINAARFPLFCAIDADSILEKNSLLRLVGPFLKDSRTVACGGSVRLANGSKIESGFLEEVGLPRNILALFQVVEYLRAFLFGRMGWSPLNGLLIISGAFGLFDKQSVIEAGGYHTDNVAEDMELVVRMHSHFADQDEPYRISFLPDPVCWTEGPEDLRSLRSQRIRWHQGLSESMAKNRDLLFKPGSGFAGWVAYPYWALFEWWGPVVEVGGYLFLVIGYLLGVVSFSVFLLFFLLSIGFGVLISVLALTLEEISFRVYPRVSHVFVLLLAAVVENFGYRQLNSYWRLIGLLRWLTGIGKGEWGEITRLGLSRD